MKTPRPLKRLQIGYCIVPDHFLSCYTDCQVPTFSVFSDRLQSGFLRRTAVSRNADNFKFNDARSCYLNFILLFFGIMFYFVIAAQGLYYIDITKLAKHLSVDLRFALTYFVLTNVQKSTNTKIY